MTKSEIMKAVHAEARKIFADQRWSASQFRTKITYRKALACGLKRAYNANQHQQWMAYAATQPKTPKFMWLRGL